MNDTQHIRDAVFFEGPDVRQRLSRFWILITLASIIAAAGVAADSTATVIGAMIVAPLMTPILGTMLSVVLADRTNLTRSLLHVAGGALVAVGIGWLVGVLVVDPVVAETNSQVAQRVHPRLIDLLAALATGAVGSVALVRRDISDTLPGVAIAISLVPPLSVVGFTFEAGQPGQSLGASLLFLTNVAAILGSGTVVMALYGIHRLAAHSAGPQQRTINRRNAVIAIAAMIVGRDVCLGRPRHLTRSPDAGGCAFVRRRGRLDHGQRHHPQWRGPRPLGGSASVAQYRPAANGAREARRRSHGGARRARPCAARHLRLTG
jgi:uncharacterized hydrophobic protein (TIGR00271 family)